MAEVDPTLLAFIRIAAMDALTNLQAKLDHTTEHDLDFDVLRWIVDIDRAPANCRRRLSSFSVSFGDWRKPPIEAHGVHRLWRRAGLASC